MTELEEENWECVWPPEVTEDTQLVETVVKILQDPTFYASHEQGWAALNGIGLGIQPEVSLIEELREKSGNRVQPFIDLAISNLFDPTMIGTSAIGQEAEAILLGAHSDASVDSSISDEDQFEETLRDKRCLDLYRGCVWELCAMFAAHLLTFPSEDRIPASIYEPLDRAIYLRRY